MNKEILIQFLPIISSLIIWLLYMKIKNQFKIMVDKEKIILENKYKIKYDEKVNLNHKLEKLYEYYVELNKFLKKNIKDNLNKNQLESVYSEFQDVKNKIIPFISNDFKNIMKELTEFSSGTDYIDYYKYNNEKFNELKIEFEKNLKNERNFEPKRN